MASRSPQARAKSMGVSVLPKNCSCSSRGMPKRKLDATKSGFQIFGAAPLPTPGPRHSWRPAAGHCVGFRMILGAWVTIAPARAQFSPRGEQDPRPSQFVVPNRGTSSRRRSCNKHDGHHHTDSRRKLAVLVHERSPLCDGPNQRWTFGLRFRYPTDGSARSRRRPLAVLRRRHHQ